MPGFWERIRAAFSSQVAETTAVPLQAGPPPGDTGPAPDMLTEAQAAIMSKDLAARADEVLARIQGETLTLRDTCRPLIEARHPIIEAVFPLLQRQDVSPYGIDGLDGYSQEKAVAGYLHQPKDVWRLFPVEDNLGTFEEMSPYSEIGWREKYAFGEVTASHFEGMYEFCEYEVDEGSLRYQQYKAAYPFFCAERILEDGIGRDLRRRCQTVLMDCGSFDWLADAPTTRDEYAKYIDHHIRGLEEDGREFDRDVQNIREYLHGISPERTPGPLKARTPMNRRGR